MKQHKILNENSGKVLFIYLFLISILLCLAVDHFLKKQSMPILSEISFS